MIRLPGLLWRFWTVPVRAERMAAFRIAVGALVAIDTALTLLPHAGEYFGPQGFVPTELYRLQDRPWSLLPLDASVAQIRLFLAGLVVASLGVASGFLTRVSSVVMWALLISFHQRNPYVNNGGDFLLQAAALYLVLMPAGTAWSVDERLRARLGRSTDRWVPSWAFRLAQIQLAVLYLFTGLSKLPVAGMPDPGNWVSGRALALALGTPTIARFEVLTRVPWWVWAPATWMTLAWELSFPVLVLFERSRYVALAFGVVLHLGIFATLEVNNFSFATLCYYVLYLPAAWFGPARWTREGERGDTHA